MRAERLERTEIAGLGGAAGTYGADAGGGGEAAEHWSNLNARCGVEHARRDLKTSDCGRRENRCRP